MEIKRSELSECELTIMKCVWDAKEPVTCPQIMTELETKYGLNYKDTTVYTFLKNLKNKGFVESERNGLTYYSPIRSEEEYRSEMLKKTEDFWFGGSIMKFASALVGMREISEEERNELKKMIDELE